MSDLDRAVSICAEYLGYRPKIRRRLGEQVNAGLKAQNLEQSCNVISNPDREDQEAGGPRVTDITGESAIRSDRARRLLSELDSAEGDLILAANRLVGHPMVSHANLVMVLHRHGYLIAPQVKSSARVFDRALGEVLGRKAPKAGRAHDGKPGCGSCARLVLDRQPWWQDPTYRDGTPTDLGGILPRKMSLDFGCYRFIIENERLPTVAELRHRRDDPRGHWPKKHVTTRRAS